MGKQLTRPRFADAAGAVSVAEAEILFSEVTPFTVDVVTIPLGAIVLRAWAEILTVFNAGTTNVLVLGHAAADDAYLAAADVNEAAVGASAAKGPFAAETAARTIQAKYTQTGTAATTGKARVFVEYVRTAANG